MTEAKETFDNIAKDYDAVRPTYPDKLFEDIIDFSKINSSSRILEIGPGTGQATLPFARKGFEIVAIERGEQLSTIARRNLESFPRVKIQTTTFENSTLDHAFFDLVYSATAFHFIDPNISYPKVFNLLAKNGAIALFWTVHIPGESALHKKIRNIYKEIAPQLDDSSIETVDEFISNIQGSILKSGMFDTPIVKQYNWVESYTADRYITLLNTHSGHQLLEAETRRHLFSRIREVFSEFGGVIEKPYTVALFLAHRHAD